MFGKIIVCELAGGDEALASAIEGEKNWRFGYIKHLQKVTTLMSGPKSLEIAKAGLAHALQNFVVRTGAKSAGEKTVTVAEAAATKV